MADLASLKIAVDSRDVKTATTDLGGMSSAAARSEGAIGKFGSTVRIATAAQRELNNAIKSTDQAYRSAATYVSQLVDQTKRLGMSSIELKKLEIATAAAAAPTVALRNEIRAAGAEYLRAMRSAQGFNAASGGVVASAGAQRAGMQQLSFQIGDVAQQFALGTSPMVIFAQQGGQVVQALSMMRGSAGGLLGFLAGPWGAVIMGAGMILGMLFTNTKKTEQGTLDLADALNIQAMSARELIGAINQLNTAQNKANATSYQTEVQARANAVAILNQAIANRELAKTELQLAIARFQGQGITSKAGLELKSAYAAQVGAARALLGELETGAAKAQNLLKAADVPLIRRQAAAATDAAAAATLRYDKAELALRNSFMAGKLTRDQYLQQLVNLNRTKETEIETAKKLEREQRKKPQVSEYERQQKAVREMIVDMERELALVKAGTAADEARLRVQLARQGANAAQIAEIVQLTKDLAAEELKREEIKKRETFGNQISDLQTELGLIRQGLALEEARLRVQLARQGATQTEIDNIIRLNAQIDGIKKAAEDTKKTLEDWDKLTLDINFDSLFGNFGKALGGIVAGLDDVLEGQKKYQAAIKAAGTDSNKLAAIENKNKRLMVNNYANLLGSAKGFFKEGSAGYKVLQAAETAYRAVSIALALKEMAIKVAGYSASASAATAGATVEVAAATSVGAANAAAAVANQGKGDPFTAWARIAAMAALMAGLGFAVMGGGKSAAPVTNTGTGTVFGDSQAQSESIVGSIERLVDINASTMRYSSQMLNSLKNIEAAMVGVTNLVLRTSGISNLAAGVNTGNSANIGQRAGGTAAMAGAGAGLGFAVAGPVGAIVGAGLGAAMSLIKGLVSSLFGTKTSIVGQGITATAQSVADILATGFDVLYYTDIQKKKKFFGITTSTSYQTQTAAADAEINRQFSLVIQNIYDTVLATAGPLKLASDQVAKNMEDFVLNIGKIDVKGLTGEEIQERLTAVFGAAADNIAKAAIPGLEAFQKVGEGYFETIIRVASNIEVLDRAFQMLGQTTQNLTLQSQMALIETFGDAATLMEQVNEYFKTFYSETEQVAAITKQLSEAMGLMGLTLPDTLAGFRALVEAQDLNTEAGRRTYAQLIQLSPAFANLVTRMQELGMVEEEVAEQTQTIADRTEILRQAREMEITLMELQGNAAGTLAARRQDELNAMDASLRAMQTMIYAQQDINSARQAEQSAIADLRSAVAMLNSNVANAEAKLAEAMKAQRQRQMESYRAQIADLDVIISKREAAQAALRRAYDAEIARIDDEISSRNANINSLESAFKDQSSVFEKTIDQFRSFAASVREFAATIIPMNGSGTASLATLRTRFAQIAALAVGGNQAAMGQFTDVGKQLRDAIVSNAPDRVTMLRQLYALQAQSNEVAAVAEVQATIAEQQLAEAKLQNEYLISIEKNAIDQLEAQKNATAALVGQFIQLNETTLSVDEAIKQLQTAEQAAISAERQKVYLQNQIDMLAAVDASVISVEQAQRELDEAKAERDAVLADINQRGFAELIRVTQQSAAQMASVAMSAIDSARAQAAQAQAALAAAQQKAAADAAAAKAAADAASQAAANAAAQAATKAAADAAANAAAQAAAKAAADAAANAAAQAAAKAAADAAAAAAAQNAVNDNVISSQVTTTVRDSYGGGNGRDSMIGIDPNIRPFAIGGIHSGGLRIVGENGPELEATGPSRIYNSNQLGNMLNHGATADEVKALREELKVAMYQIAKNTGKSYDLMNRWDGDGLPPERIVA